MVLVAVMALVAVVALVALVARMGVLYSLLSLLCSPIAVSIYLMSCVSVYKNMCMYTSGYVNYKIKHN